MIFWSFEQSLGQREKIFVYMWLRRVKPSLLCPESTLQSEQRPEYNPAHTAVLTGEEETLLTVRLLDSDAAAEFVALEINMNLTQ